MEKNLFFDISEPKASNKLAAMTEAPRIALLRSARLNKTVRARFCKTSTGLALTLATAPV